MALGLPEDIEAQALAYEKRKFMRAFALAAVRAGKTYDEATASGVATGMTITRGQSWSRWVVEDARLLWDAIEAES